MHTSESLGQYRAGEKAVICSTRLPPALGARRGVLFALGTGSSALAPLNPVYGTHLKSLTDAGYPCLTADMSPASLAGLTFGNDDCLGGCYDAWQYMKSTLGVGARATGDAPMFLAGVSGASSTFFTFTAMLMTGYPGFKPVDGIAVALPILDLDAAYQGDINGYRAAIAAAYALGVSDPIPNLALRSPVAFSNATKALLTMPIHLWTSDNDPFTTTAAATTWAASVNAITGLGNVTVESMGAIGHAYGPFTGPVVTAWLDSIGGRT